MSRRDGTGHSRWVVAWVLAALLVVLTPLAVAGAWVRVVMLDTDAYVATVAPLVDDPAVQAALADQISAQVSDAVDVSALRDLAVGPLEGLLDDVLERLDSLVREQVGRVVVSDRFAEAWESANRSSHELVVAALLGEGDLVTVDDSDVSVRGEAFVQAAKDALTEAGLGTVAGLVPDVEATFVVFSSDALPLVQAGLRLLDAVGGWMWAVALVLGIAVVLVAPRRTSGLATAAGAVALGSLLLGGCLALVRAFYLTDPGAVLSLDARAAVFDQVTALLRSAYLTTLLVAVVVMGLVWVVRRLMGTPAPSTDDQSP